MDGTRDPKRTRDAPEGGPPPPGDRTVEGVLESVVFANEETGWSVVRLEVSGQRRPLTAVGVLPGVRAGEHLRLTGRWERDHRFGDQFRVETFMAVLPATAAGMERYLASGLVRGVGKVMASRLVRRFGLETMKVIESQPERLEEVEGIGPGRRAQILASWNEQRAVREVMLFLQTHGVPTGHAFRIWRRYGDAAIAVVRENPYRLAEEVFGIGFRTADTIARALGIPANSPQRLEAGVVHALTEALEAGHVFCPRAELVGRASELLGCGPEPLEAAIDALDARGAVRAEPLPGTEDGGAPGQPVYLARMFAAETGAAALLGALLGAGDGGGGGVEVEAALARFEAEWGIALAGPQREAVRRTVSGRVLVITGGPGTGKTTIINAIVRVLEREGERILLGAPTGRAAKRVEETTGRPARTIHRLLEFNPRRGDFERGAGRRLDADLLVVDEMSMVDLPLFFQLLKAVPARCRLILVGDVDQLPSVGPGSVLRDLIGSGVVETVALEEIFRQAGESRIVLNAHRVNRGQLPFGEGHARRGGDPGGELLPPGEPPPDFVFVERDEPEEVLAAVKRLVATEIPARYGLDPVEAIQVLTPMHKGLLGSLSLNAELQALLNPRGQPAGRPGRTFRTGDKVMQLRNNYELEVFNGDLGRVDEADPEAEELTVRFDGRPVTYRYAELDELALGYACSVHKAQGSEYPAVVMPLHTQHYVLLQRNLLYTGITRGRRLVVLVGSRRAAAIAVRNSRVRGRHTRLAERLREAAPPLSRVRGGRGEPSRAT